MKFLILKKETEVFDIIFAVLAFTIPLSFALPNFFLVLAFLTFLLNREKEKSNTYIKIVLFFAAFFLLKALFNKDLIENFFMYKHIIAFALISLLAFNIKDINLVKKGFVFGVISAVIFTCSQITLYYLKNNSIPLGNSSLVSELLITHRPYFGFICFLGVICSADLINAAKAQKEAVFYRTTIALFVIFIYLIVARLALGLAFIYLFVILLSKIKFYKKKTILLIGVFISVILSLVVNNKNLKKRFHIQSTYTNTIKVISNQEPRFVIWDCFIELITQPNFNYLSGYNDVQNIQSDLNNCYNNSIENVSKKEYYLETKFNTHNQFFDFFLQGGVIGLSLFLLIFGYSFYLCRFNFMALFVIASFMLFLIVENLFHRQLGIYLVGVFIPLLLKTQAIKKLEK
jgi:hypothetical protein